MDFVLIIKDNPTTSSNISSNTELETNSTDLVTSNLQNAFLDALKNSNLTENITIDINNTKLIGMLISHILHSILAFFYTIFHVHWSKLGAGKRIA